MQFSEALARVLSVSDVVSVNIRISLEVFNINTLSTPIRNNRPHQYDLDNLVARLTNSSSVARLTFVESHLFHDSGERNRKPLWQELLLFFPQFANR